jgi:hypothetical protein
MATQYCSKCKAKKTKWFLTLPFITLVTCANCAVRRENRDTAWFLIIENFRILLSAASWLLFLFLLSAGILFGSFYFEKAGASYAENGIILSGLAVMLIATAIYFSAKSIESINISHDPNLSTKNFVEAGFQPIKNEKKLGLLIALIWSSFSATWYFQGYNKVSVLSLVIVLFFLVRLFLFRQSNLGLSITWGLSCAFSLIIFYYGFGALGRGGRPPVHIHPLFNWNTSEIYVMRYVILSSGIVGIILSFFEKNYLNTNAVSALRINLFVFSLGAIPILLALFVDCTPKERPRFINTVVCAESLELHHVINEH